MEKTWPSPAQRKVNKWTVAPEFEKFVTYHENPRVLIRFAVFYYPILLYSVYKYEANTRAARLT